MICNTLRLSENSLNSLTNIFMVTIILFKVYSIKAWKKRSTHKFVLTERASREIADSDSGFLRLRDARGQRCGR